MTTNRILGNSVLPASKSVTAHDRLRLSSLNEKQWQAWVIEAAHTFGWHVYHTYDSRRSQAGFPDLTLMRPPEVLFVELKTEKGRLSASQRVWSELLEACPGVGYYLWRPSDNEALIQVLGGGPVTTKRTTKKCANCEGTGTIVYWGFTGDEVTAGRYPSVASDKPCFRCNGTGKEQIE